MSTVIQRMIDCLGLQTATSMICLQSVSDNTYFMFILIKLLLQKGCFFTFVVGIFSLKSSDLFYTSLQANTPVKTKSNHSCLI